MPLDNSTQITIVGSNGVPYKCWDQWTGPNQIREIIARDFTQNRAERTILAAWTDRLGIAGALLGGATTAGTIYPATYPEIANWICQRIEICGDGLPSLGTSGMIAFERALMKCIYMPPQWDPSTTNTGEIELDFSSSAFALDQQQQSFKFTDGSPVSPSLMPVVRLTTVMVAISKYDLAVLPTAAILALVDCTNSGTFLGAGAEQVLFRGARSSKKFTAQGIINWDVSYAFEYRQQGTWNKLWKPNFGWTGFTDMGGNKLFPPQNLQVLIA